MAIQFRESVRNARLDAVESAGGNNVALEIRTGSPPSSCTEPRSGTILATINLPSDWMANASGGQKTKSGTWSATASATGTAGHFCLYTSQSTKDATTCFMQGTVTATGGGGDMTVNNTSFASGQTFEVTTFTLTEGGA